MVNEAAIEAAIADLESQKAPNYAATARKFYIDRKTLTRRYEGKTVSNSEAHSRNQKLLTNAQETVLIKHIRKLSNRGIYYTP